MKPEQYQPPLTWAGHAWRLALMLLVSAAVFSTRAGYLWNEVRWWFFADLALGVASYSAVWWRRRYPVAVTVFTNLAGIVSTTSLGPATLSLVSMATRRRWVEIIPLTLLCVVANVVASQFFSTPAEEDDPALVVYAVIAALTAAMVSWGMYIGSRRELLASWQARALASEAEQQAKVQQARSLERARIAREMHDILAHRISAMSMSAGALAYRTDLTGEQVRETARTIQETSHLALTELREVLGVLREGPGDAAPEEPQNAPDLMALVDEAQRLGMRVDARCEIDPAALPPTIARTLYRCVQEALTNARRHSPSAPVTMHIRGGPDHGVDLLVENPLPLTAGAASPAPGYGLVGLAERVGLHGGRQSATVSDDKRFLLHVWLPWQS
ncbi:MULTISPECIES: sensor histidine kinase [Gordonia]|uniref:sensor histidine kinase n=1 Tax=Gordonia TaxID=2053 RepID=UPI00095B1B38|nr:MULTISPECIES: histidine kinase [Gordonia]MDH3006901.1 histidine kinase [Gordonia alkanivorans]MDH3011815.1 histidine kinase [Gordonia alkanivorans]MDH3016476.1 histidine kinase [Gordonia alkanivorans]MDH3041635.1 histidine kinase [Gordonia alkanivorans]MDH3060290.1 histidine kinase [Gordonia alkanivorans]